MHQVFHLLGTPLNGARPINRLPVEVLSAIFRLAAGPTKTTDLRDVIRLSSICRHWRAIVLDHGAMWSNIRLTGQDPTFVARQVERCRGVPLHLCIDLPRGVFRVEGAPFLAHFKRVAPIIRARRSQVHSISVIIGGCRAFRRELGLDWPNLEELVWIDTCPEESRMHEQNPPIPDDHPAPKLRHLSAKQGLAWEMKTISALTTLKLEGPLNIDIFKFLRATPRLESLNLIRLRVDPSPVQVTSTDLPRLTRLTMTSVEYGQLFALVAFPSLDYLSVDPVEDQEPVEIMWGKLCVPPAIATVKIEHLAHRHKKVSITGSDEKKIQSLNLMESATETRTALMIRALCNTSLTSVTSLSVGRGVPELGVQLPSAPVCSLISILPHLRRLDIFPTKLVVEVTDHLRSSPLVCPELRILSLTVVHETCEEVFWSLSGLATDRANSKRWLHRIDCVVLRADDALEAGNLWDAMSRGYEFGKYVHCNGGGKVRRT